MIGMSLIHQHNIVIMTVCFLLELFCYLFMYSVCCEISLHRGALI